MNASRKTNWRFPVLLSLLIILMSGNSYQANAQSMGISSSAITPDASSILEMRTTTKGVLLPRMTTTERDAITSPATGLIVYNTSTSKFNFYNGSAWIALFAGTSGVNSVTGTTNRITIGGTSADPTVDISSDYAGQSSITTLGTIGTGTWNGTLIGTGYGGTGTSTTLTQGSIVFAGASGVYSQNNSKLFWDNTNFRLGIGTASPNAGIQVGSLNNSGTDNIIIGGAVSPGFMLNTLGTDFGTYYSPAANTVAIGFSSTVTVPSLSVFKVNKTGAATFGTSVATDDNIILQPFTGGSNSFAGTITTADLTAARTYTLPDASGTLATLAGTETLTNKTISGASNTLTNIPTSSFTGTLQAAQFPALTGDVTTSAASLATSIAANAVTNAKLAQIATQIFKGRTTAGTGNVEDLTVTQATAMLNTFTSGAKGLVPLSGGGTTNYLRADGTWTDPVSSLGSSYWAFDGNNVAALKKMGTTSNYDLPFITNNTEKMRITNTGNVGIGTSTFDGTNPEKLLVDAGTTTSFNLIKAKGSIDNYLQLNIQNTSTGTTASSDVVATADNGTESVNYIDMGINSSTFSNVTYPVLGGVNNAYLYSTGNDFVIGNATVAKPLRFFTGGTANSNERMRIDGSGNVAIGNTTAAELLTLGTAGTTAGTLSLAGITSGKAIITVPAVAGTPTITLPTVTGTLATLAGTETLTNKTISGASNTLSNISMSSLTGILGSANGGTANGFTKFTGPATAEKTFTLPNASATVLTDNAAVTAAQGGTGNTSYTTGDILYASGSTTLSKLAGVATGNALISGGTSTAPSWGKIGLTTHVSGTLPIANGGTNSTATPTNGGIVYGDGTSYQVTAAGTSGQVLKSNGTSAPTFEDGVNIETLASDVVNNNATANTIANVTGLSFSVTAGVTYRFRALIFYTAAATTTGSRWAISGPASPTLLAYTSQYSLTATTNTSNNASAYDIPAASNASSTATTGNIAQIDGIIKPSANGTVIVRFASEIANSAITAKAGSTLTWW